GVIRMNQHRAVFSLNAFSRPSARSHRRLAQRPATAVAFNRAPLDGWRIVGHDDPCLYTAPRRSARHRGTMVPARLRHDAPRSFLLAEGKDRVGRAANFE